MQNHVNVLFENIITSILRFKDLASKEQTSTDIVQPLFSAKAAWSTLMSAWMLELLVGTTKRGSSCRLRTLTQLPRPLPSDRRINTNKIMALLHVYEINSFIMCINCPFQM